MAVNVATLTAKLEADIRDFDRDMKRADKRLDKLEGSTKKTSSGFKSMNKAITSVGAAVAGAALLAFGKQVIGLAVDAEEAGSAFRTVFGPAVDKAQKFVKEFANSAGFAEFELQQLMATTGNIVQGIGATEEASAELSESMARLAGDVASFSNAAGGAPAVLKALQSALTGETEALKTYGIVINQADIAQRALLDTGKSSADQLTRLEKAQATLAIAYERSGKAVGDLERTQDGAANTMRRLSAKFKEAQTVIGQTLLPVLEELLPVAEDLIPTFEKIGLVVAQTARVLGPAGKVFGEWIDLLFNAEKKSEELLKSSKPVNQALGAWTILFGAVAKGGLPVLQLFDLLKEETDDLDASTLNAAEQMEFFNENMVARDLIMRGATAAIEADAAALSEEEQAAWDASVALLKAEDAAWQIERANRTAASAADTHRTALKNLNDEIRGQTDPIFRMLRAQQNLEELQKDSESSASDLAIAQLDLNAAERDLAGIGPEAAVGLEQINKALEDAKVPAQEAAAFIDDVKRAILEAQAAAGLGINIDWSGLFGGPSVVQSGIDAQATANRASRAEIIDFGQAPVTAPATATRGASSGLEFGNITINVSESYSDPAAARRVAVQVYDTLSDLRDETLR